jgi:hypothetical protein
MKKPNTTSRLITDVTPSNWIPSCPEDFIGVARGVAGILALKSKSYFQPSIRSAFSSTALPA